MKRYYFVRGAVFLVSVVVGAIAFLNVLAGTLSPGPLRYQELSAVFPTARIQAACRAVQISVWRSDLSSDCAVGAAAEVISGSQQKESILKAQTAVIQTLSLAPHESKLWLALALVQSRLGEPDAESLKMSYLTGSNEVGLIPLRLSQVVAGNASNAPGLGELAASDVRLILFSRPDLKTTLKEAYRQASSTGKTFIENRVGTLEPSFMGTLKSAPQ